LQVLSVEPSVGSARLLVTVGLDPASPAGSEQAIVCLERASGKLRCEVASAIHRKKAPELAFCVIAAK
jgi:ribosome-binding factor A